MVAENSVRLNFGYHGSPFPRPSSRRSPLVSMVESSHLGELDHLPQLRPLHAPGLRSVAGQRQMAARPVVLLKMLRQDPPEVHLVQHDDVV